MRRRFASSPHAARALALLVCIMVTACCAASNGGHESSSSSRSPDELGRHALLIGIGEYAAGPTDYPRLLGPRNDLALLEEVLTSDQYGFATGSITTLVDGDATYAAIESAFADLADPEKVGADDLIYIHFSGHGGRVTDVNGDEPQEGGQPGKDSTLVPHDARQGGVREILDDVLSIWLARIVRRTPNVVLVVDSCHSGSITRAPNGFATRAALTEDEGDYSSSAGLVDELAAARATLDATGHRFVRISAAQDVQYAVEYTPPGRNRRFGLLTWYWARALRDARPTDSYELAFTRLQALIRKQEGSRQRPHIEGATSALLFQGRLGEPQAELVVRDVDPPFVTFQGGLLRGVTAKSVYRLRGTGGTGERPAVDAEITSVDAVKSEGRLLADATVAVGDLFEETVHHHAFHPLRVFLWKDGPASGELIEAARSRLADFKGVDVVDEEGPRDLIVRFFTNDDGATVSALLDANERPYGGGTIDPKYLTKVLADAEDAEAVAENVRKIERANSLMNFTTGMLDANGDARVELLRLRILDDSRPPSAVVGEWIAAGGPDDSANVAAEVLGNGSGRGTELELRKGTILAFRIANLSEQDLYFHFANVKPNGEVALFLPKGGVDEKEARVAPGGVRIVTPLRLMDEDAGLTDRYVWLISEVPAEIWRVSSSGFRGPPARPDEPPPPAASRSLNAFLEGMTDVGTRAQGLDVTEPVELAARQFRVRVLP